MNEKELVKWFASDTKRILKELMDDTDEAKTFKDFEDLQRNLRDLTEDLGECVKKLKVYDAVRQLIEENIKKD